MCGIFGLIRDDDAPTSTSALVGATQLVRHRGPDDEGYMLWEGTAAPRAYAGNDTDPEARALNHLRDLPDSADWRVAFGHRRLSIVDLSAQGHQPMVHREAGLVACYNGEIYNHLELREDLGKIGHRFRSRSDTEVLLAAWAEWGTSCLDRLNGMFAFLLLDPRPPATLHAVRDRFGVKPLYF